MNIQGMLSPLTHPAMPFARLVRDRRGVAAVEFAFVVPILLSLYFVTMEVAQGIETNKKVGRVASMVADLVTQTQETSPDEIDAIMKIGQSTLNPYNRSTPTITVTGIEIKEESGTPKATVLWSRRLEDGSFGSGLTEKSSVAIPADLLIKDTFLVRVDAELDYEPVITWSASDSQKEAIGLAATFDQIEMEETYYLRPRMSNRIPCEDC